MKKCMRHFNDCYWYLKNLISSIQEFQVKELVVEDILRWFVIISVSVQIQKGKYHGVIDTGLAVVSYKNPRRIDIDAEDIVYHLKVSYMEYCSFHLKNYHFVNSDTHSYLPSTWLFLAVVKIRLPQNELFMMFEYYYKITA